MTPSDFRSLMAGFPTGVAIVATLAGDGRPWGMTCSSVCSVTVTPPTLLVCVRQHSPTLEAIIWRSAFTVNLLHENAQATAELFASGAPDRFDRVHWQVGPLDSGPHLYEDAHAIADCRVSQTQLVGDHVVVFGTVSKVSKAPVPPAPLLYGLRRYASWPQ